MSVKFAPGGKTIVSGGASGTIKVWGERPFLTAAHPNFRLRAPRLLTDASSLDLVTEKTNAHSTWIRSVDSNHDGSQIVSASDDRTIKVWDGGALAEITFAWPKVTMPAPSAGTLDLKATNFNAHNGRVFSVAYNKDGDKIVSGGLDATIKVWTQGVWSRENWRGNPPVVLDRVMAVILVNKKGFGVVATLPDEVLDKIITKAFFAR